MSFQPSSPRAGAKSLSFPSRLHGLDIARGLAALAVVLWHWQHFFFVNNRAAPDFDRHKQPLYAIFSVIYEYGGHLAVQFFFTLSGFIFYWLYSEGIKNRSRSFREFAVARFARLYPLYLISLLLVVALQWAFFTRTAHTFVYENNDGYHFLLNLFFISSWGFEKGFSFNAPVWSVSVEIALYLVFFVLTFLRFCGWKSLLGFLVTIALLEKFGLERRWSMALECFFSGGLAYHAAHSYISCRFRTFSTDAVVVLGAIACWLVFLLGGNFMFHRFDEYKLYGHLLFPLTIVALVICEIALDLKLQPMNWVGDMTYSSYLLHFPLQIVFMLIALQMGIADAFYSPWMLFAFMAVLIAVSLLTYHHVERPLQSIIRSRFLPRAVQDKEFTPPSGASIGK